MFDAIDIANFAIVVSGLTISIMGLFLTLRTQYVEKRTSRFLLVMFSILIAYAFSDLSSQISLICLGSNFAQLSKTAIFSESFFSSLLMPLLTLYMLRLCNNSYRCHLFNIVMILWIAYFILLVITQFTDFIYNVTPDNIYMRGPLYPVLLVPPVLLMLVNLVGLIRRKPNLTPKEFKGFLIYILVPAFSMIIQMLSYGVLLIVLGTAIASFILFLNILNDASEKFIEQRIQISEQAFRARTLQIRPHFIYNTMSNIYYLCEIDPKKAQAVVDDFSTYLKKNFSAITREGLIPFEEELEHTRAYLNVVKVRYDQILFVEYDTSYTAFRLPPLTLEPIVENAVKHALDPESDPLHIYIRTEATDEGSLIIVENTGNDFPIDDSANKTNDSLYHGDDKEPHIGIDNVRSRLKVLCKGTLSVSRREGGGTVVTIFIPAG